MPTLLQYRQRASTMLGSFVAATASGGTTSSLIAATTDLLASSVASSGIYEDWYLFRPNAGSNGFTARSDRVRRVATYDPSTATFTPDYDWLSAPTAPTIFAAGEPFELHGFVEPSVDMASCINEGLKQCYVTVETTLTPTPLATRHSLAAATWIDEPWKVRAVGLLTQAEDRDKVNPYQRVIRGSVTDESGIFYLNHPGYTFNATDTLYVWTVARAYDRCAQSSANYGSQTGLLLDSDKAPATLDWVAQAALIEAYRRFSGILDRVSNQRMGGDRLEAASSFTLLTRQNFRLPLLTFRPITPLGPLSDTSSWLPY